MQKRVRVRRDRPSALSWALALAVTMLAVYLVTLSAPAVIPEAEEAGAPAARVTRELTLAGTVAHLVDLGVHSDGTAARIAAANFAQRGAAGVVLPRDDGFHVIGACYENEADAARIAQRLSAQEIPAGTLTLSAQAVSLRITAPESDADAIAEADRALRSALCQAGALALQIDRGENSASQARTLAAVARSELDRAERQLAQVAGAEEQRVCAGLLTIMRRVSQGLSGTAKGSAAGATLSGQLRCIQTDGTLELIAFLSELS